MRILGLIAGLAVLLGCVLGFLIRFPAPQSTSRPQVMASAYDRLAPGVTTLAGLAQLGFDTRAARRVSELGMIEQFVRRDSIDFDSLDRQLKECLLGQERCTGYVFPLRDMPGTRALVVTVKDRVAYKTLTGQILTSAASPSSGRY
jgi:hypothetical protein